MEEQAGKAISPELKASMDDLKEAADTLRRSYQEPVDSLKKQLDPEALADQEIEIPPARPASAGTPAVQKPSPAAPFPG